MKNFLFADHEHSDLEEDYPPPPPDMDLDDEPAPLPDLCRVRAQAVVKPLSMEQAMLAVGSERLPLSRTLQLQSERYGGCQPPPGQRIASERPGGESFHREELKRRAGHYSRSFSEAFSFLTSTDASLQVGNSFLEAFTNHGYRPSDVPFRSFNAMSNSIVQEMLPNANSKTV